MKSAFFLVFLALIFSSGFCSLVYQLLWDRLAKFNFGGDNVSSIIILSSFLSGLGIGAFIFKGKFKNPFMVLGAVEILIGIYGLISYSFTLNLGDLLLNSVNLIEVKNLQIYLKIVLASYCFLFGPCILIGATLPLTFSILSSLCDLNSYKISFVYGLNVLGSFFGVVSVPFVFLNNFSINETLRMVGSTNIIIGLSFIILHFLEKKIKFSQQEYQKKTFVLNKFENPQKVYFLAFLTGFLIIVYEIIIVRHTSMVVPSSAYNFPLVIAAFLVSLSFGSFIFSRYFKKHFSEQINFVCFLLLFSMIGLNVSIFLCAYILKKKILNFYIDDPITLFIYLLVIVFPFASSVGSIFPTILSFQTNKTKTIAENTGKCYLFNSFGSFCGAIIFSFYFAPKLGTEKTLFLLGLILFIFGNLFFKSKSKAKEIIYRACLLLFCICLFHLNKKEFLLGKLSSRFANFTIVEGHSGIASVNWYDIEGNGAMVSINGQGMGAIPKEPQDERIIREVLNHIKPKNILILGLATGTYLPILLNLESCESITVVEWSREIPKLMSKDSIFTKLKMPSFIKNPKVRFIFLDARIAVKMLNEQSFDLVLDTLCRPDWPGATGLKTPEYFQDIAKIMTKDGKYVHATLFRGWKNSNWNENAWRNEVLAGIFLAFKNVSESRQAGFVVACSNPQEYNKNYQKISENLCIKTAPFNQTILKSEYFLSLRNIFMNKKNQ